MTPAIYYAVYKGFTISPMLTKDLSILTLIFNGLIGINNVSITITQLRTPILLCYHNVERTSPNFYKVLSRINIDYDLVLSRITLSSSINYNFLRIHRFHIKEIFGPHSYNY